MTDDTANTDPAEEATEADPLATAQAEIAKLKDDLLRALAETENTRRRGERAAADARVYAIDRFARDLLPVADALARAQDALPPGESGEAALKLLEGVALTEKTLIEAFGRHGLKPVGAKGEAFDANLHQAVAQIPSDAPAGAVAEVFQIGFMLADRTLRPAMVAVSLGAGAGGGATAANDEPPREGRIDIKV